MQLTRVEAAVVLGILIPQISSLTFLPAPPDCWAALDTCLSDFCDRGQAFYGGICNDESCKTKGSEVCNMTIQTALDQFPSLRGCVCAWGEGEVDPCVSIRVLAEQCRRKPASHQKRSTVMAWESSALIGRANDGAGSCFDQMTICLGDAVCNKHLIPVLQACAADPCDRDLCQQAARHFYGSMPQNVAEMLVMCECDAPDESCLQMKTSLHSGPCAEETQICQERVKQCLDDGICSDLLESFRAKCWGFENDQCGGSDLGGDECLTGMDPALISGMNPECKMAFVDTLGTVLHRPCSCKGVHSDDLRTCNMIHDVLHNRSVFTSSVKSSGVPSKPPELDESERRHTWSHDYLLYAFATVLLVGVVVLMPLAVVSKIWMLRKRDETKFHHPEKSRFVVIL